MNTVDGFVKILYPIGVDDRAYATLQVKTDFFSRVVFGDEKPTKATRLFSCLEFGLFLEVFAVSAFLKAIDTTLWR